MLAANVTVAGMRTHGDGSNRPAFDYRVRAVLENEAVFAGARLALVPVAEDIFRLGRLLRDERPFHAGREASAAASSQARIFDLRDDRVRLHAERLLYGFVTVQFQVAIDIRRSLAKALRNHANFVGMRNERSHL